MLKPATDDAACRGPELDARGGLSAGCIACGKCDAVQKLLRGLVPARMNQPMTPTANAAR